MMGCKFNPSYIGRRNNVARLVPEGAIRILDVGCSIGALGENIKRKNGAEVTGIEIDKEMARVAKQKLDRVVVGDIETINLENNFAPNYFECIIFADVLEHLKEPWDVLKNATKILGTNGVIIISIPNVRHYTTISNLVIRGYWPYEQRGTHDKNHLRFFTFRNIKEMLQDAGLTIVTMERHYRIEKPHQLNKYVTQTDRF